jgi:IclR family transcriptional regulator, acetate operon repressor
VKAVGVVQSLTRALLILDALAEANEGLTLTAVARAVSLPPSSAHRLLTTLQAERFVRFEPASMTWHVGIQAFVVGNSFARSRDLVALARPYMRRPMEESGETVNLFVLDGGEAVCVAQVRSAQVIGAISRPGGGLRMHRSAAGKAMLAYMPTRTAAEIVNRQGMLRSTSKTIVDFTDLQADLTMTRSRGFAVDDEEFIIGLRCVAAPILDEAGVPCAALSIAGPTSRLPNEKVETVGRMIVSAARSVTLEMGGVAQGA